MSEVRFRGVPSFFRACCREASYGGSLGYDHPAYQLSRHLNDQIPDDAEADEWQGELDRLADLLEAEDGDGVWGWFGDHYPRCVALVPQKRRHQFVAGVLRAYQDEEVALNVS